MQRWGVIVLHPSRREAVQATYRRLAERLASVRPGYIVWLLDAPRQPVLEHAAKAPENVTFSVVPLLLAPGKHWADDVRGLADAISAAHAHLRVTIGQPLLEDEAFLLFLLNTL